MARVLQILDNLLSNARHALIDAPQSGALIKIRINRNGDNRVRTSVHDNGIGISKDNLAKIFEHGFTTKKDGHGFGLHSSANAAKEMGGSLIAHSDGLGQGATFVLELPFEH